MFKPLVGARWITAGDPSADAVPEFRRDFTLPDGADAVRATLYITALGVYEAELNGRRVGDFVMAPGWTSYEKRLQVQACDVTDLLRGENRLSVRVGKGWYASPMPGWAETADKRRRRDCPRALIARLEIVTAQGETLAVVTDDAWQWVESPIRFSELYDGECCDATFSDDLPKPCALFDGPTDTLIPQEGEEVRRMERLAARSVFTTPAGETVVDFGQEITGWVECALCAYAGDEVRFVHGEVLDRDGNFYNANYRGAKAEARYICREGQQTWHAHLTFFGFRYIRLDAFPGAPKPEQFTAVAVYSNIRQTGFIASGHEGLNQLVSNVLWSQRGNFLDVPTDCPQRDERLGWTGDAQVFALAACLNYDVERFFAKWLKDLAADQFPDGGVGSVAPNYLPDDAPSAAWGDAAVICPWTVYQTYGDADILRAQFDSMCRWVDYITAVTTTPGLWTGGVHFGDWLALDAPAGTRKGASRVDFIASAFYAHAAELVAKAGRVLGRDVSCYEALHRDIVAAFRRAYPDYRTQTEHVLAVHFHLAPDEQAAADALAAMIRRDGTALRTGFVGTPYLLHALSDHGHADLAWALMLRREYPSWLYPVSKGATTIWEHWDGITADGGFWSAGMNSFNHYAYGAVIDWLYMVAAGIRHDEAHPGFAEAVIAPHPHPDLGFLRVRLETRRGPIESAWTCLDDAVRYEISTPVPAAVTIDGVTRRVSPGRYVLWGAGKGGEL